VPGAAAQLAVVVVEAATAAETLIVKLQSVTAVTSMYWPSQKRPPVGAAHCLVQPPVSTVVQVWSHVTLFSTVQEPLQLSSHSVVQSVFPGFSMHDAVHCEPQLAWQSAEQVAPVHMLVHPASQLVLQSSVQLKVAGAVVHVLSQVFVQVSVHVVVAVASHMTEQVWV
jgi:hypothetical protein